MTITMTHGALRLSALVASPLNARQTAPDEEAKQSIDGMADSIALLGLLQPLIVHELKKPKGKYGVLAGGRRLAALNLIRDQADQIQSNAVDFDAIPVVFVTGDEAELRQISLSENVVRAVMTDVDIYRGVKAIRTSRPTTTDEELAHGYGVPLARMKRILRLAFVHPEVLQAYANGLIDNAALIAFGGTDDQARQLAIYEQFGNRVSAWQVKQAMGWGEHEQIKLFHAVGAEAYQEAGGTYTADLFSDNMIIDHPALLLELFAKKCADYAAEQAPGRTLIPETPKDKYGYNDWHRRAYPKADLSKELSEELVYVANEIDVLSNQIEDALDWDDKREFAENLLERPFITLSKKDMAIANKVRAELGVLLPRMAELEAIKASAPMIIDPAATLVTVTPLKGGELELMYWFPESAEQADANPANAADVAEAAPDPAEPAITQRARDWLKAERSNIMRSFVLSDHPHAAATRHRAHDALIFSLGHKMLNRYTIKSFDGLVSMAQGHAYEYQNCGTKPLMLNPNLIPGLSNPDTVAGFLEYETSATVKQKEILAAYVYACKVEPQFEIGNDTIAADVFAPLADPVTVRTVWTPRTELWDLFKKDTVLAWIKQLSIEAYGDWSRRKGAEIKAKAQGFFDGTNPWTSDDLAPLSWVPQWLLWRSQDNLAAQRQASADARVNDAAEALEDESENDEAES